MSFSNSSFGNTLQIDGLTLQETPIGIAVIPNNLPINYNVSTASSDNIVISSDYTLIGDIICNDFTINSGITLTTNGYNIYCNGNFINNGIINCGTNSYNSSNSGNFNYPNSYAGSGGGSSGIGGGGNTLITGGSNYNNGSTPNAPVLSNSLINTFYTNGMKNYLSGAGGGSYSYGYNWANGSYGIYIQAVNITAGIINAVGTAGYIPSSLVAYGGGGGGTIILSYLTTYTAGTYNISGGDGANAGNGNISGAGGNGQVLLYNYTTAPIIISAYPINTTLTNLYSSSITLSAEFNVKTSIIIQISGSTSQPCILYYNIDGINYQTINAYNGSVVFISAKKLAIGTHIFQIQGILTSGTTSCSADLTAFLIEQIIGNGG